MYDYEFGVVKINLQKVLTEKGISKTKLAFKAELQVTQLNHYLKGDISRVDLYVLARICNACQCDISDILEYVPPGEEETMD